MAARKKRTSTKAAGSLLSQSWRGDPDLKNPKHDQMSFAMVDKDFVREMIVKSGIYSLEPSSKELRHIDANTRCPPGIETADKGVTVHSVELEVPVLRKWQSGSSVVGFWDAVAEYTTYCRQRNLHCTRGNPDEPHGEFWSEWVDDVSSLRRLYIEAKTSMTNPMEVLRQMKFYQAEIKSGGPMLLWCPGIEAEIAKVFRMQNIYVFDGAPR